MDIKNTLKNSELTKDKNIEVLGRFGYAARAVVYGLVGIFAILLSFQERGALTDSRGILQRLLEQPFGKFILAAIAAGLFFFAIWRVMQAVRDYENKGRSLKGIAVRVGYAASALGYVTLSYYAINLIFQLSKAAKQSGEKELAQAVLGQSFGTVLLGVIALVIVGIGVGQIYLAFSEKFKVGLQIPRAADWLSTVCKIGICARGIVFCLMGWLFMRAALHANSSEADGLKGVWKFLAVQNYGSVLVAAMALGLIAFSIYGFTEAVYRRSVCATA